MTRIAAILTAAIALTLDLDQNAERLRILILCDGSNSGGGVGLALPVQPGESAAFLDRIRSEVIRAIGDRLRGGDAVRVASFGDRFRLSPRWVYAPTGLSQAFESIAQPPGNQSPIWDAVSSSIDAFEETPERRILFVVSDGKASGNVHGFDEALARVTKSNVTVYVANVVGRFDGRPAYQDQRDHPAYRLKKMVEVTRGEYAEPAAKDLPAFFGGVLKRLNSSG